MEGHDDTARRLVELLSTLVACPSVNPGEREASEPPFGESRLAALLGEMLTGWGARVEVREIEPGRSNVTATFLGADPSRTLLLEAHADTVSVGGMTIEPFTPTVRDGRLFGRGACDTKGPMAAMLGAIRAVLDAQGTPPTTLIFAATCDEEAHSLGMRALLDAGLRPDAAIVGEPTGLKVVCAHKGVARFRIRAQGRAAHSSTPAAGVNAISHMARVVQAIDERIAPALAQRRHPLLGAATVAVGLIGGGTQVNVIPADCWIEVDRRLLPGETVAGAEQEFRAALDALAGELADFAYSLEPTAHFPPFDEGSDGPVARLARAACEQVLGRGECVGAPWAANSGFLAQAGVPCVVLGPGSIAQAHTPDEWIDLAELVRGQAVYERIIHTFGL